MRALFYVAALAVPFALGAVPVAAPAAAAASPALAPLDAIVPDLDALYMDLHRTPELSMHKEKTAAKIAERLRKLGYEVTTGVGGNGVVAILKNGAGNTVPVMHACGHDLHMTSLIGAATLLARAKDRWRGTLF